MHPGYISTTRLPKPSPVSRQQLLVFYVAIGARQPSVILLIRESETGELTGAALTKSDTLFRHDNLLARRGLAGDAPEETFAGRPKSRSEAL